MADPARDDVDTAAREPELIDLALLGAADPARGVAVRGVDGVHGVHGVEAAEGDAEDFEDAEDLEDEDYEPGWLGTVLRWPIRIVAVIVIAPFQIAWESVKAVGRVAWRGLSKIERGIRKVASVIGWPFRMVGRGLSFVVTWLYFKVLTPVGHVLAAVAQLVGAGIGWLGRQLYRWILRPIGVAARAVGRVVVQVLYYLSRPIVLLGRGLWYVLKLLGGWIAGLFHVVVEACEFAARVGAKVGRGVVWLWTHSLWVPIRFAGKGFWDAAKWVGRGLRVVTQPVARGLRAVRNWYRQEITEPVKGALRAARRDIRRALFGRGRG